MMTTLLSQQQPVDALQQWQKTHQQAIDTMASQMSKLNGTQVSLSALSVMISEINKLIAE